jgi:hypothetical protein
MLETDSEFDCLKETPWDVIKASIRNLPASEIVRLNNLAGGLEQGLQKLNSDLSLLPQHEREAAVALMKHRLMETISDFHLAVIGLVSHQRCRRVQTEFARGAALRAFDRDLRELAEIYHLPFP